MAINISVYSNANSASRSISFDFVGEIIAANHPIFNPSPANVASTEYYFKVTTSAVQDNSVAFPVKIMRGLDELVLNSASPTLKKQRMSNTGADYANVKSMVVDYVFDYINGHKVNENGSECTYQGPMKFR